MTGRTHDLAAFTALSLVVLSLPPRPITLSTMLLALLANQIGGIAPDIDQPTAPLWRNLPIGNLAGKVFSRVLGGHRFLTHSLVGLALMGVLIHLLLVFLTPLVPNADTGYIWWAFMIGMVSHLVLDSFTKEGVPWLLPLPIKFGFPPLKRLRVTTGKKLETLVIFPGIALVCGIIYASNYEQALKFFHDYIV